MFAFSIMVVCSLEYSVSHLATHFVSLGASDQAVQISTEDLRVGLATYINKELGSQKSLKHLLPVPLTGKGLYHSCSDPLLLW